MAEYPKETLIASIQHQAEKLGYLTAEVEEMFANRVKEQRHAVTVQHSLEATKIMKRWLAGEIDDDTSAELGATLSEATSHEYDLIKGAFEMDINRLREIVTNSINAGKSQQNELNQTLDSIFNERDIQ